MTTSQHIPPQPQLPLPATPQPPHLPSTPPPPLPAKTPTLKWHKGSGKAPISEDGKTIRIIAREIMAASDPGQAAHEATEYIIKSTPDKVKSNSRLGHLRRALRDLKSPEAVIDRTQRRELTIAANKAKDKKFTEPGGLMTNGPIQHPFYQRQVVSERLAAIDTQRLPTKQNIIDIMVALCMRPAELKSLRITEKGVTGFAKGSISGELGPRPFASILEQDRAVELLTWAQKAIADRKLPDPGVPGSKAYRKLLAQYNLMPKDMRAIGAKIYSERVGNDAERMHMRKLALRHLNLGPTTTERYANIRQPKTEIELMNEYLDELGL